MYLETIPGIRLCELLLELLLVLMSVSPVPRSV